MRHIPDKYMLHIRRHLEVETSMTGWASGEVGKEESPC